MRITKILLAFSAIILAVGCGSGTKGPKIASASRQAEAATPPAPRELPPSRPPEPMPRGAKDPSIAKPPAEPAKLPDDSGWVQLFNGKDLTGWKVYPSGTGEWKVEDGAIHGSGPASHLFSERGDYENFRFRLEAKISDQGNSGQYFRTQFGPRFPKGYEAQINSTGGDPIKTGSLYPAFNRSLPADEREKLLIKDQLAKPDEWFTQEVIAQGNHIVILVNGKTTVDFVDEANTYTKGHFAIQQHDPGSKVWVRKAEVKELPAK